MGKVAKFFKGFTNTYYNWRKRNERIDALLDNYNNTLDMISSMKNSYEEKLGEFQILQSNVQTIVKFLDTIKEGTKIELAETLHNWRELLVVKRGWASPEEKKEVSKIYTIYHNELEGNGSGEHYYKEIIDLPESPEELEKRKK